MSAPLVLPLLVLAAVLLVSGLAKLGDRRATADMFTALRVPLVPPGPGARLLPYAEVALSLALLAARGPALVVAAVLALGLFAAYWLLIARALTFDPLVSCACFGRLGGHRVERTTLVRNTVLVALAGAGLAASVRGVEVLPALGDFDRADMAWLAGVLLTAALAWTIARGAEPLGPEDYVRAPIPYAAVERADGTSATLRELALTRARLLVLLSPGCGSCTRVAERLDGWTALLGERVGVHAVYAHPLADLRDLPFAADLALHDPEANVSRAFGSLPTPAAVLLGADGLLAGGPVVGERDVGRLVEDMRESLSDQA